MTTTRTPQRLRGEDLWDVVKSHGERACDHGHHNTFVWFDDYESARACADDLKAGGVWVVGVYAGDPGSPYPRRRLPQITFREQ